jgi:hypothetical protein
VAAGLFGSDPAIGCVRIGPVQRADENIHKPTEPARLIVITGALASVSARAFSRGPAVGWGWV